ncbi:uncharacterized protein LOC127725978 [Mytilus californianus]|uniref:uncharacterized protein LOC127725978 n=1 Tax=Mytilus californianus TaxID=6549 RepID=UPI002246D418|nr:uncharacterized protein LOC127725978 [Mytilus californianus]
MQAIFVQTSNNSLDIAENQTEESNQSENEDRTQINSQETSATPMITQSETNTAVVSENIASTALLLPQHNQNPVSQPCVRTATRQPASKIMPASAAETSHQSLPITTFETAFDTATARTSGQASATNDNESRSLQENNTQYKEQGICMTCNSKNVPVAFLQCGHIDCCKDCASAMLKCPMCKVDIKQSLKRKVTVSSQSYLQQMEEIQNYICPSEEGINVQNTQQSALNNSEPSFEIQQLFKESEFHLGNAIPMIEPVHGQLSDDGPSVPRICDNNTPIIRALFQNQNNFEGLPLIIQVSSVSSQFDNTCTIDTPLMIIFCQMFTNQNLYQLFANSIYEIFRVELPNLLSLLMRRDFDDVRREWSEIIGHRGRRNFYGSDANFVMNPFSSLLLYHHKFNCTNFKCPTNERSFVIPGLTLPQ